VNRKGNLLIRGASNRSVYIICLCLISFQSYCQYNVVKLDAVGFINPELVMLRGVYERSLTKTISVGLGLERGKLLIGYDSRYGERSVSAFGITPEVRVYPFNYYKPAPLGFFIGSHLRYRRITEDNYNSFGHYIAKANSFQVGVHTGYKVRMSQFVAEFLFGRAFGGGNWTSETKGDYSFDDFMEQYRIEISLGFIFPKFPGKDKSGRYLYL
jgi:hypothetical protein